MKPIHSHDPQGQKSSVRGLWEFRALMIVTTLFFLPIAAISRLLPKSWRPLASYSSGSEGIFQEAHRAAARAVPCAFMG
ncbi:MAG: hypothetical protein AAF699_12300 [Pseudomonadota bacterium]